MHCPHFNRLLAAALLAFTLLGSAAAKVPPNVIVILTDDQGWGELTRGDGFIIDGISQKSAVMEGNAATPDRLIFNHWRNRISARSERVRLGHEGAPFEIEAPHDPELTGMENDRVSRIESYVKDFKAVKLGNINLESGRGLLALRASDIPRSRAIDARLLMLKPME